MATSLIQDRNDSNSIGVVCRKPRFNESTTGKPILAIQVRLNRTPDMPIKRDARGRPEPDFPFFSIQGSAAVSLADMPVNTPVVITGAVTTRWVGKDTPAESNRHMVTEIYVKGIAILQIPGQPPSWVPPFQSDADAPLPVGVSVDGFPVVAAFKSANDPLLNLTTPAPKFLRHARKGKHQKNKANRHARIVAAQVQSAELGPDAAAHLLDTPDSFAASESETPPPGNPGDREGAVNVRSGQ